MCAYVCNRWVCSIQSLPNKVGRVVTVNKTFYRPFVRPCLVPGGEEAQVSMTVPFWYGPVHFRHDAISTFHAVRTAAIDMVLIAMSLGPHDILDAENRRLVAMASADHH